MPGSTVVKKAMLKITADDGDTEAKLDRISAKADELAAKHPEIKVKIDAAAAAAKMAVLRNDLKSTGLQMAANAAAAGNQSGQGFMSRFGAWLKPSKFQLITSAVALGLAALPALGAGAGALAGIALGAGILIGTKQAKGPLYDSFHDTMSELIGIVRKDAQPLIEPLKQAFTQLGQFAHLISPLIRSVFAALGPAVRPLEIGFENLIGNMLPGFITLMRAAHPAVSALASLLGNLGADLGSMFRAFAGALRPSGEILKGLGEVLNGLLPLIGNLAGALASALGPAFAAFGTTIKALSPALTAVGKILGDLAGAILDSLTGALTAIAALARAAAPAFTVLASAFRQVFNLMENSGVFGVLEDSLEKLAAPLGRLISALITGLAPILPVVLGAIAKMSTAITSQLAAAVISLMPSLTQLVTSLATMLADLTPLIGPLTQLSEQFLHLGLALLPLLPPIIQIMADFAQLAARYMPDLARAIVPVINAAVTFIGTITKVVSWIVHVISSIYNFEASLGHLVSSAHNTAAGVSDAWNALVSGVEHMVGTVVAWFEGLGGKIKGAVSDFGGLLISAGESLISGLSSGITGALGGLLGTVENMGSTIIGVFKHIMSSASPSKVFMQIGRDIVLGLALGIGTSHAAVTAAKQLAKEVVDAFKSGRLTGSEGTFVSGVVRIDTEQLKYLAAKRKGILQEIANAQKYALSTTQSAEQFAGLGNIVSGMKSGQKLTGGVLLSGLQADLAKIRKFNRVIGELARKGLDRDLLGQIIQAGPLQGLAMAEALLEGPQWQINALNKTESRIKGASYKLGRTAAEDMYDSGKMAGKGFLSGLEAQKRAIETLMERIARDMVRTLKRELGIKSPSSVARQHGQWFGEGFALGIDDRRHRVSSAAQGLARAALGGYRTGAQPLGGAYGGQRVVVEIDLRGGDTEFMTWLKKTIRARGGDPSLVGR